MPKTTQKPHNCARCNLPKCHTATLCADICVELPNADPELAADVGDTWTTSFDMCADCSALPDALEWALAQALAEARKERAQLEQLDSREECARGRAH